MWVPPGAPPLPFDNFVVLGVWLLNTIYSPINFVRQLMTLGFSAGWAAFAGFFGIPQTEFSRILADIRTACRQYLDRHQWANFVLTVGGGSKKIKWGPRVTSAAFAAAGFGVSGVCASFLLSAGFGLWAVPFLVTSFFILLQSAQFIAALGYMLASNRLLDKDSKIKHGILYKTENKLGIRPEADIQLTKAHFEGSASQEDQDILAHYLDCEKISTDVKTLEDGIIANLKNNSADPYNHFSYNDLILIWGRLRRALIGVGAIKSNGRVKIDESSPILKLSEPIIGLFAEVENLINAKANHDLRVDPTKAGAWDAINFVADKSSNFAVGYAAEHGMALFGKYIKRED